MPVRYTHRPLPSETGHVDNISTSCQQPRQDTLGHLESTSDISLKDTLKLLNWGLLKLSSCHHARIVHLSAEETCDL